VVSPELASPLLLLTCCSAHALASVRRQSQFLSGETSGAVNEEEEKRRTISKSQVTRE
jgi:hypothetical protein